VANLLDALAGTAFRYAASEGVTVVAESNLTPSPVTLFDARDTAPSLLDVLGVRVHVVAKTQDGKTLAEYGEPVSFNPALALIYGAVLVLGVVAFGVAVSLMLR